MSENGDDCVEKREVKNGPFEAPEDRYSPYDNMRDEFTRGYVQVYTGDGKGKTTAAIGLAIRALGAGMRVYFAQFIKSARYSEIWMLERLAGCGAKIVCRQYGDGCFIFREPSEADRLAAKRGLDEARAVVRSGEYDLVVLDEANVAVALGLLDEDDLLAAAGDKPDNVELVFTGRCAPAKLMETADLVTEMREIRHYYQNGVIARRGIES
jgi:cob(I)alamin adenosyltransferase